MTTKSLIIVESPTKATKIQDYLGSKFIIESSAGHVVDLVTSSDKKDQRQYGIDIKNNFTPEYEIIPAKKSRVRDLKKKASEATEVILATDEDREGEAIAWHLCRVLDLDVKTTKRIVYREITKPAILAALKEPRVINQNLVDAQQARRVLDRLVGFDLSGVLWRKIKYGLSAGRVQSVAVRLLTDREQAISDFNPKRYYRPTAILRTNDGQDIKAELNQEIGDLAAVNQFLEAISAAILRVEDHQTKPAIRRPPPPFKTSSLQQEASGRLGYSPRRTMRLAQELYENGQITYMRTDSQNLSQGFIKEASAYIKSQPNYGQKYSQPKQYSTKAKSAQEAHEAIRPTMIGLEVGSRDPAGQRLYQLIRNRALASQMAPAQLTATTITVASPNRPEKFTVKGSRLEFDGFLRVAGQRPEDVFLPDLKVGDQLEIIEVSAPEKLTRPPSRYTEASLIGQLEDAGIGRPSTYAPIVSTIIDRGYVEKKDVPPLVEKTTGLILKDGQISDYVSEVSISGGQNKLVPTALGDMVTAFLAENFNEIMDYQFTSRIEAQFDKIANGDLIWNDQVGEFYKDFQPLVQTVEKISRDQINQTRQIGVDPKDKQPIYARLGRFGPMLQKGDSKSDQKPEFAPLPEGTEITTVSLEEALEMFKLPRVIGQTTAGVEISAKRGPFGAYIEAGGKRVSLKDVDPLKISLAEAEELINDYEQAQKQKVIQDLGDGITVLDGRFGAYVSDGQTRATIPKQTDPKKINLKQAQDLIAKKKARGPGRRRPPSKAK